MIHYFSILSTYKFIQPHVILIHGDCSPKGKFWSKIRSEVPNLYHVHEDRLTSIQGKKPRFVQHEGDVMRLQILLGLSEYTTSKTTTQQAQNICIAFVKCWTTLYKCYTNVSCFLGIGQFQVNLTSSKVLD